jgi:hypothetical protein
MPPWAGLISPLATSTVVATQDLRKLGQQLSAQSGQTSGSASGQVSGPAYQARPAGAAGHDKPGLPGHYIRCYAVGADCYVAFDVGGTVSAPASLTSLAVATTGVNAANACVPITAGTYQDFLIPDLPMVDVSGGGTFPNPQAAPQTVWVGYLTLAGTGTLRIVQASQ